jgi:hypothetical protein
MAFWSPETASEDLQNQKIQTEVAELINPESQTLSKIKNAGTNRFF